MLEITLACGAVTLVSPVDYPVLIQYRWRANRHTASGLPYVCRSTVIDDVRTTVYMHREIAQAPPTLRVDHKDRDTLNNRRSNLRLASFEQNNANRAGFGLVPYKGVSRRGRRFRARINIDEQELFLGYFDTAEAAALAYDRRAFEAYGAFAYLNFPERFSGHPPEEAAEIPF